jgi:Fe-S cluster assembly ATPase SufC
MHLRRWLIFQIQKILARLHDANILQGFEFKNVEESVLQAIFSLRGAAKSTLPSSFPIQNMEVKIFNV